MATELFLFTCLFGGVLTAISVVCCVVVDDKFDWFWTGAIIASGFCGFYTLVFGVFYLISLALS